MVANADRGLGSGSMSRDIIDLAMMTDNWDSIPDGLGEGIHHYDNSLARSSTNPSAGYPTLAISNRICVGCGCRSA
jgi:hypothetical protein